MPLDVDFLSDSRRSLRENSSSDQPQAAERLSSTAKRLIDVTIAFLALIALAPLLLLIAGAIAFTDSHPVVIRHKRVGKFGRPFMCLKFRTMVVDADAVLEAHMRADPKARAEWESNQKLVDDPRVTPLGRFLRATSLDELPQLLNVLRGEMSLVGPRPIVASEVRRYGAHFDDCFSVSPGITGLWQVSGRNDCSYAERVALDAQYAKEWSLSGDLSILVRTVPAVLFQRGSR